MVSLKLSAHYNPIILKFFFFFVKRKIDCEHIKSLKTKGHTSGLICLPWIDCLEWSCWLWCWWNLLHCCQRIFPTVKPRAEMRNMKIDITHDTKKVRFDNRLHEVNSLISIRLLEIKWRIPFKITILGLSWRIKKLLKMARTKKNYNYLCLSSTL